MSKFDPSKSLAQRVQAFELPAVSKLKQQLEQSPLARLQRYADGTGPADWASRTIQKELDKVNRLSELSLGPSQRAMRLLSEHPTMKLYDQVEAFSKRMDSFGGQAKSAVDKLDRFEKLVSIQFAHSLKQIDAFVAATEAQRSWGRYTEFSASLERLQARVGLPPALAELVDRLDQVTREAEAAGAGDEATADFDLEQREQAAEAFEALVADAGQAPTAAEQVDRIIDAIKSTQDSTLKTILLMIVVPFLLSVLFSVVNPVSDYYIKKSLEQASSPQEQTKVVKQEGRKSVSDVRLLADYRFVSVPTDRPLEVKAVPASKALRLGELRMGQVVTLLETTKAKDFALVEWRSEDGTASLKGWVYSRYLKKFE